MASGNEKFTIAANKVQGMVHDVPPTYDETNAKTTAALPNQTQQYPAPHNLSEYPPQQPAPYVYQQQVAQAPVHQNVVQGTNQTMPNDYYNLALMVTLMCCLPIGIVALIKSNEVKRRSAAGDFDGAVISSTAAKRWSVAGIIVGSVTAAIVFIVYIAILY